MVHCTNADMWSHRLRSGSHPIDMPQIRRWLSPEEMPISPSTCGAMATIASFEIAYRQFLDPEGRVTGTLPEFARDPSALLPLYRAMVLTRTFDAKAVSLQRTGRLGTYPPCLGQEAIGVGVASAMHPDDVLFPSYRDQPAQLWRGVSPSRYCSTGAATSGAATLPDRDGISRFACPSAAKHPMRLAWHWR
jgi:hypothetical protein